MKGRSKEGTTEEIPPLFEFSFYNETRFFFFFDSCIYLSYYLLLFCLFCQINWAFLVVHSTLPYLPVSVSSKATICIRIGINGILCLYTTLPT